MDKAIQEVEPMEWSLIAANWESYCWSIHEDWPQFTEEEIRAVSGDRTALVALVERRYRLPVCEAERQVFEWEQFLAEPMAAWEMM